MLINKKGLFSKLGNIILVLILILLLVSIVTDGFGLLSRTKDTYAQCSIPGLEEYRSCATPDDKGECPGEGFAVSLPKDSDAWNCGEGQICCMNSGGQ
jgi:hypothetical protein